MRPVKRCQIVNKVGHTDQDRIANVNVIAIVSQWQILLKICPKSPFAFPNQQILISVNFLSARDYKPHASSDRFCLLLLLSLSQISLQQHLHTNKLYLHKIIDLNEFQKNIKSYSKKNSQKNSKTKSTMKSKKNSKRMHIGISKRNNQQNLTY